MFRSFEVDEVLAEGSRLEPDGFGLHPGRIVTTLKQFGTMRIGNATLCTDNPDLYQPQVGETVLVFGRADQVNRAHYPGTIQPVVDDRVVPFGYVVGAEKSPLDLDRLRAVAARSHR